MADDKKLIFNWFNGFESFEEKDFVSAAVDPSKFYTISHFWKAMNRG